MTYLEFLEDQGYKDVRLINDDLQWIGILPLLYTHAVVIGTVGNIQSCDNRWCYHTHDSAKKALDAWDGNGEPEGWHRNPMTGRRRKSGDPTKEYINY